MIDEQYQIIKRNNLRYNHNQTHYSRFKLRAREIIFNKFFYVRSEIDTPFVLSSDGRTSKYYFDIRHMMMNAEYARMIAKLFRHKIMIDLYKRNVSWDELDEYSVGGMETGAILLSQAIMFELPVTPFYVRKQEKTHGNQRLVVTPRDFNLPTNKVIIIDDVCTSGKSILTAIRSVKKYYPKAKIVKAYCLVDRSYEFDDTNPVGEWNETESENIDFEAIFESTDDFISLLNEKKVL